MKNRIICIVLFILSLLIGGYCVYAAYMERGNAAVFIPSYAILTLLLFPFASIFHEGGHAIFGAMVKIKVRIEKLRVFNSSSCLIIPKTDKNLKGRIIFTTLGGLAANFFLIVFGVIAMCVDAMPADIGLLLPSSFYLFCLNALPLELDGGKTDGQVIKELVKNEDSAKVMLAVLTAQAQILNGKPISEIDEKLLFDLPQIREDDRNFIALTELRYEFFNALGDEEKAEFWKHRFEMLKEEYL